MAAPLPLAPNSPPLKTKARTAIMSRASALRPSYGFAEYGAVTAA